MRLPKAAFLALLAVILVSCSGLKQQDPEPMKTINLFLPYDKNQYDDNEFLKALLAEAFPEYQFRTFDVVSGHRYSDTAGVERDLRYSYSDFEAAGFVPDLIIEQLDGGLAPRFLTQGYTFRLDEALRTTKIDLGAFESSYLGHIRAMSTDRSLIALPLSAELFALLYDRGKLSPERLAGIESWEDLIRFSEEMPLDAPETRQGFGTAYYFWKPLSHQLALRHLDEHDRVAPNREEWTTALELMNGIRIGSEGKYTLFPFATSDINKSAYAVAIHLDQWDLIPFPKMNEADLRGPNRLYKVAAVGPSTRYLADVLRILEYLTSYELQLSLSRYGIPSVLNRPEMSSQFGADSVAYADKRADAFFALDPRAAPARISKYERTSFGFSVDTSLYHLVGEANDKMKRESWSSEQAYEYMEDQLGAYFSQLMQVPPDEY